MAIVLTILPVKMIESDVENVIKLPQIGEFSFDVFSPKDKFSEVISEYTRYIEAAFPGIKSEESFFGEIKDNVSFFLLGDYEYFIGHININKENISDVNYLAVKNHMIFSNFASALWHLKDNSVNMSESATFVLDEEGFKSRLNRLDATYTNSSGKFTSTYFSKEEILNTIESLMYRNLDKFSYVVDKQKGMEQHSGEFVSSGNIDYTNRTRLQRCFSFIDTARATSFLPAKVSNYCSALESLLATGDAQISRVVSERCANFLKNSTEDKVDLFKLVKKIYNTRSKYVHGVEFTERLSRKLLDHSNEIDNIVRDIFNLATTDSELIEVMEKGNNDYEDWYLKNYTFK